jgi:hypothetical protein
VCVCKKIGGVLHLPPEDALAKCLQGSDDEHLKQQRESRRRKEACSGLDDLECTEVWRDDQVVLLFADAPYDHVCHLSKTQSAVLEDIVNSLSSS